MSSGIRSLCFDESPFGQRHWADNPARARRPGLVVGLRVRPAPDAGRDGSDDRGYWADLGRAGLSFQPAPVGAMVGTAGPRPEPGRILSAFRPRRPPLLLAICSPRDQLSPSSGRAVEPVDARRLRALDERYPVEADGLGDRVFPDDHAPLRVSGATLWSLGGGSGGGLASGHAQALRGRPSRGDRHPRPAPLGGDGPGVLEGAV